MSSHRDRTSSFHHTVSPASPSFSLTLAVRGPITLPDLVDVRIRDRSRALVCKPSKWKCLACLQNFISVHLVLEQWIRPVLHLPEQEAMSEESHQSWPTLFVCLMPQGTRHPSAGISSSKRRVSSGFLSCGLKGASTWWIFSQSISLNHACTCGR